MIDKDALVELRAWARRFCEVARIRHQPEIAAALRDAPDIAAGSTIDPRRTKPSDGDQSGSFGRTAIGDWLTEARLKLLRDLASRAQLMA